MEMAEAGVESAILESSANGKTAVELRDEAPVEEKEINDGIQAEPAKETSEVEAEMGTGPPKDEANDAANGAGDGNEQRAEAEDKGENESEGQKKRGRGRGRSAGRKASVGDGGEAGAEGLEREPKKRKPKELSTPVLDRPLRERKSIERFVASNEKENVKELTIEKGSGTPLKDIPNVAYKLSKRSRADDTLKVLHTVLYGKRAKAFLVKNNILQFSGFVWGENEGKLKGKVKDKLEKYHKDNLLNLCDVLDIHAPKTGTKKEELVVKLMDFLEAPHITTDVLLEEKEQKLKAKKRKRKGKGSSGKPLGKSSEKGSRKRQRKVISSTKEEEGKTEEDEEEEEKEEDEKGNDSLGDEDDAAESEKEAEEEEEDDEDYGVKKKGAKRSSKKGPKRRKTNESTGKKTSGTDGGKTSPGKALRSPVKGSSVKDSAGDNVVSSTPNSPTSKVFSRKNKKEKTDADKSAATDGKKQSRKQANAAAEKSTLKEREGKNKAKGKPSKTELSDEDLRAAICEILKEVDFNTATFTDIVKRLAGQFDVDFSERKAHVKVLIQEELSKLAEGEDEEDQSAGAEGNTEKDESEELTGQVVEAE